MVGAADGINIGHLPPAKLAIWYFRDWARKRLESLYREADIAHGQPNPDIVRKSATPVPGAPQLPSTPHFSIWMCPPPNLDMSPLTVVKEGAILEV